MTQTLIPIGSLALALSSFIMTIYFNRFKHKADITPVLVFTYRDGYQLENFGNGPALDVIIYNSETNEEIFIKSVSCFPLSKGSYNDLIWVKHPGRLGVTYKDLYGNQYTSFCQSDKITSMKGKKIDHNKLNLKLESERAIRWELKKN